MISHRHREPRAEPSLKKNTNPAVTPPPHSQLAPPKAPAAQLEKTPPQTSHDGLPGFVLVAGPNFGQAPTCVATFPRPGQRRPFRPQPRPRRRSDPARRVCASPAVQSPCQLGGTGCSPKRRAGRGKGSSQTRPRLVPPRGWARPRDGSFLRPRVAWAPGVPSRGSSRIPSASGKWAGAASTRSGYAGLQQALTVMATPWRGGDRGQEGGRGSRAGPSSAGTPPPPPPLSAARRSSSSPSLPRRGPSPFHPPIKLFFFFKLPGRTWAGQWAAETPGQTAAGQRTCQ